MKKALSLILVCVLMLGVLTMLVSCGGLSGTYKGNLCTLKFSGSKVTATVGENSIEGTYEISKKDDGTKTISFDFIDSDSDKGVKAAIDALMKSKLPLEEDGDSIKIGYFTFKKQ